MNSEGGLIMAFTEQSRKSFMKVLTDNASFEKWFIKDYLNINNDPLNSSIFTDEELACVLSEAAPRSFPCLVLVDSHNVIGGADPLRYIYKQELRLMQKLLEGNGVSC